MKEGELIELIARTVGGLADRELACGIGDDCAVIADRPDRAWLISTDTLVEGVHFDPAWHPARLLGRKAVSVTVSDVAAMGGVVRYLLFSLALPADFNDQWVEDLARGMGEACRAYGCLLIGGDTVRSPSGVSMTLTVLGSQRPERVVYRSGAGNGDVILVSGPLGLAAAGLELLRAGRMTSDFSLLEKAHLDPRARVGLGRLLGESGLVHAMMDLSDGLGTDLARICSASGLGAELHRQALPCDEELCRAARLLGRDPLAWLTGGGEEYELLLTVDASATEKLQEMVAAAGYLLYPVGRMVTGQGVRLVADGEETVVLDDSGFDHFGPG